MKARELNALGIPKGLCVEVAIEAIVKAVQAGVKKEDLRNHIETLAKNPSEYREDPLWGALANTLISSEAAQTQFKGRAEPAPYRQWGDNLEPHAVSQIENACRLPVSVAGALMPDAHMGYGLPIGGVLATRSSVIPFAVGNDIACRMKLTVLELPADSLQTQRERLSEALERETCFGTGAHFRHRKQHPVMDENWAVTPVTAELKDRAWEQLGSSGSGNHFVEFGTLTLERDDLGLKPGVYLALLSHSGSRGTGAGVAAHYSKLAMAQHPELPKELVHLAWLDLGTEEGQQYWAAMELMGRYAAANHQLIHQAIAARLGVKVLLDVENHHNFAWKETYQGEEVIVHRKGATPAGVGVLGIIPGSMGTAGYVVRGRGFGPALGSASHGAGRRMSRTAAKEQFTWEQAKRFLDERGVVLLSGGLDEVPMAYKDIEEVMAAQQELVEPIARFEPKLVKMAPGGEKPED